MFRSPTLKRVPLVAAITAALALLACMSPADEATRPWRAPARAANVKNPLPPDANSLAAGKALYVKECAACHGAAGKGNGPDAADLSRQPPDFAAAAVTSQSDGE